MAAKKDDVTTYTKPELIKALRASVAREAKLRKQYDSLLDQLAKRPKQHDNDTYVHGELTGDEDQAPAFPWERK